MIRCSSNRFLTHHQDLIKFSYSCFDRIILNGMIPSFIYNECGGTIKYFLTQRQVPTVNHAYFKKIASDYHDRVACYSQNAGLDIVELDQQRRNLRREELVEPYFQNLGQRHGPAVILKAREPERIAWHFAQSNHLALVRHFVKVYYFYLNDSHCGRMFIRICPYFPFNIRVWMNGHHWLACQLQRENISFVKRDNLFVECAQPQRLQELADAFAAEDMQRPVQAWLAKFLPVFTESERQQGFGHQLYMNQMEYCHNVLFHKRAALERLFDRLMDANRSMGRPDKLAIVFGRAGFRPVTRDGHMALKMSPTRIPVLNSGFKHTGIKQYVSNGDGLRTESSSHQLQDLSVPKHVSNLPKLRTVFDQANQRYLQVQQDILVTYVDRDELRKLRQPSFSPTGRRLPGLHIDDPRLLAVLQAILCFTYLAGKGVFRTKDVLVDVQKALGNPDYRLSQLRYDLSKFRGKGLLLRLPKTQTYQLSEPGCRLAVLYLKLYQRFYGPLTSAIQAPFSADQRLFTHAQCQLDRLYLAVDKALQRLTKNLRLTA